MDLNIQFKIWVRKSPFNKKKYQCPPYENYKKYLVIFEIFAIIKCVWDSVDVKFPISVALPPPVAREWAVLKLLPDYDLQLLRKTEASKQDGLDSARFQGHSRIIRVSRGGSVPVDKENEEAL